MSGVDELLGKAGSILEDYFTQRLEALKMSKKSLRQAFRVYGPRDWTDEEVSKEAEAFRGIGDYVTTLKLALMQASWRISGKRSPQKWELQAEDIVETAWQRWLVDDVSPKKISEEFMHSQLSIQGLLQEMTNKTPPPTPTTTNPLEIPNPSPSSVPPGSQWEYNLLQQSQRP